MKSLPVVTSAVAVLAWQMTFGGMAIAGEPKLKSGPTAKAEGQGVRIEFAVAEPCDADVAVLDEGGREVRHLAAGVLGAAEAADPLAPKSLSQSLLWDRLDDRGKPVPAGKFKARVRLGIKPGAVAVILKAAPGKAAHLMGPVDMNPDPKDPGRTEPPTGSTWPIWADQEADIVYARQTYGGVHRYSAVTGKVDDITGLIGNGHDPLSVGPDGALSRGPYRRWSRDLKPMPLPEGTIQHQGARFAGGHNAHRMATAYGNKWGPSFVFEGLDGRYYLSFTRFPPYFELHIWDPWENKRMLVEGYQPWVGLGESARMGCMRVDPRGNAYILKIGSEKGKTPINIPTAKAILPTEKLASIIKFDPLERWSDEIKLPFGAPSDDPEELKKGIFFEDRYIKNCFIPRVKRVYNNVMLQAGCSCSNRHFDIDEYGRLYIPHCEHLIVLDNAGNKLLQLSNTISVEPDGKGPTINLAGLHTTAASRKAVYAFDNVNLRILRIGLEYAAVEECGVPAQ